MVSVLIEEIDMSDAIREAFEALDELYQTARSSTAVYAPDMDPLMEKVKTALQSQTAPAVPEGWKLVPVEPTPEQKKASLDWNDTYQTGGLPVDMNCNIYRAMLTAAPQPDHSTDAGKVVQGSWDEGYEAAIEAIYQPVDAIYSTLSGADVQLDGDGAAGAIIGEFLGKLSKMISDAGLRFNEDGNAIVLGLSATPSVPEEEIASKAIAQFKDELVNSVKPIFRPHIEGVCAVVIDRLRTAGDDGEGV